MKSSIFIGFTIIISLPILAQELTDHIKKGNQFYKEGNMAEAIREYDLVTQGPYLNLAQLNKGNALFRQKQQDAAIKSFLKVSQSPQADASLRSAAFYNAGVVFSNQKKIDESIEAYKNALRLNSQDQQARENLQKALLEKKQQGGGGGEKEEPNKTAPSNLNKSQAQQQLNKLEEKEKNTQERISGNKSQYNTSNEKDW